MGTRAKTLGFGHKAEVQFDTKDKMEVSNCYCFWQYWVARRENISGSEIYDPLVGVALNVESEIILVRGK